jgi:hypothetical protein
MLLQKHKSILPALVAIIGGMICVVGQSQFNFVTSQDNHNLAFTPTERPKPQRTQGGGSRNHEAPFDTFKFNALNAFDS